eukprot:1144723-Pelagomonas_calceolata.AAC.6
MQHRQETYVLLESVCQLIQSIKLGAVWSWSLNPLLKNACKTAMQEWRMRFARKVSTRAVPEKASFKMLQSLQLQIIDM